MLEVERVAEGAEGLMENRSPKLTDSLFNGAYWYMDWLLIMPILLVKMFLVAKLHAAEYSSNSNWTCKVWPPADGKTLMSTNEKRQQLKISMSD